MEIKYNFHELTFTSELEYSLISDILKNDIDELEFKSQKSKILLRDHLCETRAGNTCFLLTITDFSNNCFFKNSLKKVTCLNFIFKAAPEADKVVIVITARVHPGKIYF